ncbi:hypothetical protein [Halioglobus japonicus]|nr:hypothetical protein [Halioglobus japonicus]
MNSRFTIRSKGAPFSSDFDPHPTIANEKSNEESANAAITGMLQGVREMKEIPDSELELIGLAAAALFESDPALSQELANLSEKYQSRDPQLHAEDSLRATLKCTIRKKFRFFGRKP